MQVDRLSPSLQDELQRITHYNTARSETLFDAPISPSGNFGDYDIADLNITEDQIANLLSTFADEIVSIFGSTLSFITKTHLENADDINPDDGSNLDRGSNCNNQGFIA